MTRGADGEKQNRSCRCYSEVSVRVKYDDRVIVVWNHHSSHTLQQTLARNTYCDTSHDSAVIKQSTNLLFNLRYNI